MMKIERYFPGESVMERSTGNGWVVTEAQAVNNKLFYLAIGDETAWGFDIGSYVHQKQIITRAFANYNGPPMVQNITANESVHITWRRPGVIHFGIAWNFIFDSAGRWLAFAGWVQPPVNDGQYGRARRQTLNGGVRIGFGSALINLAADNHLPFPEEFAHNPADPVHWLQAADHDRDYGRTGERFVRAAEILKGWHGDNRPIAPNSRERARSLSGQI